ncbi:hypothetical protein EES44_14920 [Streptomyces sp. ADI96-15]|nr:hypothetical protein EES44_14920 [Streptomyces sp. ADI96-15]
MTLPSRLRSSTAVRESKPRSWKARWGLTVWAPEWPRTTAIWPRTRSSSTSRRSASARPARRAARPVAAAPAAAAVRRTGVRISPLSSGGTSPWARSAGRSRRTGSTTGSPEARAASNRAVPCPASTGGRPDRAIRRRSVSDSSRVIPASCAHGPQTRETPGSPRARRYSTNASRNTFPAAYAPCPALPNVPATDENTTNASRPRSRVASCRFHAASTFGRNTAATRSAVSDASVASSMTPAACTTARTPCRATSPATASASAASHASTATCAPASISSVTSSPAPSAVAPLRLTSSRSRTPCVMTRWRASIRPRPPVPPVISTGPVRASQRGSSVASGVTRARRGTRTSPSRTADSASPEARAERRDAVSASAGSSNRPTRPGCSEIAERTSPRAAASASPVVRSVEAVTKTRRDPANRSSASHDRTRARARAAAVCAAWAGSVPSVSSEAATSTVEGISSAAASSSKVAYVTKSSAAGTALRASPRTATAPVSAGPSSGRAGTHSTW